MEYDYGDKLTLQESMKSLEFVPALVTGSEQKLQRQFLAVQHAFPGMIWDGDMRVQSECEERDHALEEEQKGLPLKIICSSLL